MVLKEGMHCAISVVAILATSDMLTLNIPPRTVWASLPVAAALLTVLFISATPQTIAPKITQATALVLLLAISSASVAYTAQHPTTEEEGRAITHYIIQGGFLLAACVALVVLCT